MRRAMRGETQGPRADDEGGAGEIGGGSDVVPVRVREDDGVDVGCGVEAAGAEAGGGVRERVDGVALRDVCVHARDVGGEVAFHAEVEDEAFWGGV